MKIRLCRAARVVAVACVIVVAACAFAAPPSRAQRGAKRGRPAPQYGKICFDPTAPCQTNGVTFEAHDLPFRLPKNAVIFDSEEFYAVILKSVRAPTQDDCEKFIPEGERLEAQKLFARRKVFSSRCVEPGSVSYTNVAPMTRIL
ncbi:MAG: hypothetical protein QOF61_405, partial [Acidobacteriota bacterium]|nr:hypothetical protein [Acidobacteriota bacterium]